MTGTDDSMRNRLCFTPELSDYIARTNMPIIVTGATGWLGRATLEMLDAALAENFHIRVSAFSNSETTINLRSGKQIASHNLKSLDGKKMPSALIFHYAFLTREHALSQSLADYVNGNGEITRTIFDFVKRNGAHGIFVPSSGAVYTSERFIESDLHSNPYGVLKFEDETRFQSLAQEFGFPCAIMRVFNLSGPFINKLSSYALASIIRDVTSGGPIVLHANKKVVRSYAYVEDIINLATSIIQRVIQISPFDTAGERMIEIGELAGIVSQVMHGRPIEIIRPDILDSARDLYCGDERSYFRLAKTTGLELKTLEVQIQATALYVRSILFPAII